MRIAGMRASRKIFTPLKKVKIFRHRRRDGNSSCQKFKRRVNYETPLNSYVLEVVVLGDSISERTFKAIAL